MAEIEAGGSKKGRRVNVELNLVPFIDLMSVLITFLLLSAVWVQINMIQMGTSFYAQRDELNPPKPPPLAEIVLKIDVKDAGYVFTLGKQITSLPNQGLQFDDVGLLAQLQKAKELYPEKVDAVLAVSDDLPYERMVFAMDLILKAGFPTISLATGNP